MPVGEQNLPDSRYLNMLPASITLWRQWLHLYEDQFETFYYNVRVGAGVRPPADFNDQMKRDWWALTALRIDAVGERQNQTWVIEVAERPTAKILGNLQLYKHLTPLYQGQNAQRRDVIANRAAEDLLLPTDIREVIMPALISRFMGSDMAQVVQNAGILSFVFPGSGAPTLPPQFLPSTVTLNPNTAA